MSDKLPTEHHLEFLSLKGGCTGLAVSTLVKIPYCWKSHGAAHIYNGPSKSQSMTLCYGTYRTCLKSFLKHLDQARNLILVRGYIYVSTLCTCMRAVEALTRLCVCADSSEPFDKCTGSYIENFVSHFAE